MEEKALQGVTCDAKECAYNHEGKKCCAPSISVTGLTAQSTPETACDTFKQY